MSAHRVWLEQFPDDPGSRVTIGGEEAHHAVRVKRMEAGARIELADGKGRIGRGAVTQTRKVSKHGEWEVEVEIESVERQPRPSPRVEVWSAAPKGDRLASMIDGLAQVGAASWSPLISARSVVEPRDGKMQRLERVSHEACKQCGRAWAMEIGREKKLSELLSLDRSPDMPLVIADASGDRYERAEAGAGVVRVLIGPEGGWSPEEIAKARVSGAIVASFGAHVMRIEVAAVVAAAMVGEGMRRASKEHIGS